MGLGKTKARPQIPIQLGSAVPYPSLVAVPFVTWASSCWDGYAGAFSHVTFRVHLAVYGIFRYFSIFASTSRTRGSRVEPRVRYS